MIVLSDMTMRFVAQLRNEEGAWDANISKQIYEYSYFLVFPSLFLNSLCGTDTKRRSGLFRRCTQSVRFAV